MKIHMRSIAVGFIAILITLTSEAAFAGCKACPIDLLAGARRSIASVENDTLLEQGKVLVFEEAGRQEVAIRAIFKVKNPERFASLTLQKPLHVKKLTLNGKAIPVPLEGMIYAAVPARRGK